MANYRQLTREEYYLEKDSNVYFAYKLKHNPDGKFGHYTPYKHIDTGIIDWFWANDTVSRHTFPKDEYEMIYG